MATILGIGTLLSQSSAKKTFSEVNNFRIVEIPHVQRCFNETTKKLKETSLNGGAKNWAGLSAFFQEGTMMMGTAFEVPDNELNQFYLREKVYCIREIGYLDTRGGGEGLICLEWNDVEMREHLVQQGFPVEDLPDVTWYTRDILPNRDYMMFCIQAARKLSSRFYENFLDTTFLVDKKTTLRQFLSANK